MRHPEDQKSIEVSEEKPEDRKARCFFAVSEAAEDSALPPAEKPVQSDEAVE